MARLTRCLVPRRSEPQFRASERLCLYHQHQKPGPETSFPVGTIVKWHYPGPSLSLPDTARQPPREHAREPAAAVPRAVGGCRAGGASYPWLAAQGGKRCGNQRGRLCEVSGRRAAEGTPEAVDGHDGTGAKSGSVLEDGEIPVGGERCCHAPNCNPSTRIPAPKNRLCGHTTMSHVHPRESRSGLTHARYSILSNAANGTPLLRARAFSALVWRLHCFSLGGGCPARGVGGGRLAVAESVALGSSLRSTQGRFGMACLRRVRCRWG